MKKPKRLTEAEWEIMEGIWLFGGAPTPAREVHSRLYSDGRKAYPTVQTLLNILVEKGFLKKELVGMVNFYTPTTSRDEMGDQETRTLVSRVYGGSFGALAHHLVNSGALSPKDLRRLKALIEDKEQA